MPKKNAKAEPEHYFRVIITYIDGETSGHRLFQDRAKAEIWVKRQKKSPAVKKVAIELFTRLPYARRSVRKSGRPKQE